MIKAYCEEFYSGPTCQNYCKPTNISTCNSYGDIVCNEGFYTVQYY